jgi:hypothetical protein
MVWRSFATLLIGKSQKMNLALPNSRERVPAHTAVAVNRRLRRQVDERVDYFAKHKSEIPARLSELDREWDIERAIEMNAAAIGFTGIVLAATVDKRWLVLPALVTGFLFQHAVQGWCPPVPVLRRLGFRTVYEIEDERHALDLLRSSHSSRRKH